jgi:hypothetical protein
MPKKLLTRGVPPKISMLFKDSKDALACRDILSWYTKLTAKEEQIQDFDTTKVGHWLLEHHQPFIDDFTRPPESHTRISYRLQSKRPYIKNRINDLLGLGLIEERGTTLAEKGVVKKRCMLLRKKDVCGHGSLRQDMLKIKKGVRWPSTIFSASYPHLLWNFILPLLMHS